MLVWSTVARFRTRNDSDRHLLRRGPSVQCHAVIWIIRAVCLIVVFAL